MDIGDHKSRERTIYELKKAIVVWEKQNPDKVKAIEEEKAARLKKEEEILLNKSDLFPSEEAEKPTRRVTFLGDELSEVDGPSDIMKAIQQLASLKRPWTHSMSEDKNPTTSPPKSPPNGVKKPRRVSSAPLDDDVDDAALRERAKEDLRVRSESARSRPTRFRKGLPSYVIDALTKRSRRPGGRSNKRIKPADDTAKGDMDVIENGNPAEGVATVEI